MKHLFCLLFLSAFCLKSQTIMTFQQMEKSGISISKLDSIYPNSIKTAVAPGVFKGKDEKKFEEAWGKFYMNLMQFIAENNFKWGKQTYCFNKIYFNANGQIEYWFFNFKKADNIPQDKQDRFLELLKKFCSKNKIDIKGDSKFSQCASVDFIDM